MTKHFTRPFLPREPGLCGLGQAGWGSQAAPAGLCTAPSPCTLHMSGCLKLLQQPARGDPSPLALPRRSSFLLCTPGVLRGPRHPQPCSPQPAEGLGQPPPLASRAVAPTWGRAATNLVSCSERIPSPQFNAENKTFVFYPRGSVHHRGPLSFNPGLDRGPGLGR